MTTALPSLAERRWSKVLADPHLQGLPFKVELNRRGKIELSPICNLRGSLLSELAGELHARPNGRTVANCSIETADGIRVADVAWISNARLKKLGMVTPMPQAPEICVEIMSPSNTWAEIHMKASYYLEAGAEQVWVVALDGKRTIIDPPMA